MSKDQRVQTWHDEAKSELDEDHIANYYNELERESEQAEQTVSRWPK